MKSILGFWFFYALTIVARAFLGSDPMTVLSNKLFTIVAGIVVTGFFNLHPKYRDSAPPRRASG